MKTTSPHRVEDFIDLRSPYSYLALRPARELLLQTAMSIMQVAVACGFQSPPHFSKCYRMLFGHTPSAERHSSRHGGATGGGPT